MPSRYRRRAASGRPVQGDDHPGARHRPPPRSDPPRSAHANGRRWPATSRVGAGPGATGSGRPSTSRGVSHSRSRSPIIRTPRSPERSASAGLAANLAVDSEVVVEAKPRPMQGAAPPARPMRHRRRPGTLHAGTTVPPASPAARRRTSHRAADQQLCPRAGRPNSLWWRPGRGKGRRPRPVGSADRPRRRSPVGPADHRRRAWSCGPGWRCPPRSAARRNPGWRRRPRSAGRRGGKRGRRDRVEAARGPADGRAVRRQPPVDIGLDVDRGGQIGTPAKGSWAGRRSRRRSSASRR
jgi:hypothetical protein